MQLLKTYKNYLILSILSLITTALIWLPFALNLSTFSTIPLPPGGMQTIQSNFDGPYYLVVAQTWYDLEKVLTFEFDEPAEYYAAHFPGYPLTIALINYLLPLPYAMLISSQIFLIFTTLIFYHMLHKQFNQKHAFWITCIFMVFPARWLATKSVGTPEPQFLFFTLLSIYYFNLKRYWISGLAGAAAILTKSPGILLFASMGMTLLHQSLIQSKLPLNKIQTYLKLPFRSQTYQHLFPAYPLTLIPIALISLWFYYAQIYGNFFAYFEAGNHGGALHHLFWPPFQMFDRTQYWVGTFWLEDIIWQFSILFAGIIILWNKKPATLITWYSLIFTLSVTFVSHRDIARYTIPLIPMMFIAFAPYLSHKYTKILLLLLIIPLYLYAINFISGNTTPISDWSHFI